MDGAATGVLTRLQAAPVTVGWRSASAHVEGTFMTKTKVQRREKNLERSNLKAEARRAKRVVKSCTINRSAAELFGFWRNLENLPRFARHLVSVKRMTDKDSHWVAKSPAGTTSEWNAEI